MKRLSLFASLALVAALLFSPAFAAVAPADHPVLTPIGCQFDAAVQASPADFAVAIVAPAVDQFTCDAALLAETGLCLTPVAPARVSFAFVLDGDPVPDAARSCPPERSPTS